MSESIDIGDQTVITRHGSAQQYRLVKRMTPNFGEIGPIHTVEYVLQGAFYWTDDKGNGGHDWQDIATVEEYV